jgi:PPOX class probable F420-dependent enzyme
MSNTTGIASNKYVSLTTFTKDGTPKPLPVWVVELGDGRVGFTTSRDSWKVKRILNTPKVTLRPSDQRGRVADDAVEVTGVATVSEGDEFTEVKALVKSKYGLLVTLITAMNAVRGLFSKASTQSDTAVLITLD